MIKIVICILTGKPCIYPLCKMKDYFTPVECPYAQIITYSEDRKRGDVCEY